MGGCVSLGGLRVCSWYYQGWQVSFSASAGAGVGWWFFSRHGLGFFNSVACSLERLEHFEGLLRGKGFNDIARASSSTRNVWEIARFPMVLRFLRESF